MAISNYLENKELDHVYGRTTYTPPATLYVQLFTADPTDTGTGTPSLIGVRAAVPNDTTNFPGAANGSKSNGLKISFGSTTGNMTLVDCTHVGIFDAASGGNMLDYGPLNAPLQVADKVEVFIAAGGITISRL